MSTAITRAPKQRFAALGHAESPARPARATRIVVSTLGVLAALAGIEHGIGEILQGRGRPDGLVIESWPDATAMEVLSGEPAMTVAPDLLLTGILAILVALVVAIWAASFVERRRGSIVLIGLSLLLLLVGGGFGPPLLGVVVGIGATRIGRAPRRSSTALSRALGGTWSWFLAAGVLGYLGLMPGTVLLSHFAGFESTALAAALSILAFASAVLAVAAARAHDAGQSKPLTLLGDEK